MRKIIALLSILSFSALASTNPSNSLKLGDGTASDKKIILNIGGSNPTIKWNNSTSKFQIANDGSTFFDISNLNPDNVTIDQSGSGSTLALKNGGITGTKVSSSINLPGDAVQEDAKNVVVSNANATKSLALIRGVVAANATITAGEGFTVGHAGTGLYDINFTTSFADTPGCAVSPISSSVFVIVVSTLLSSRCSIIIATSGGTATDVAFSFVISGQRL